MNYLSVPRINLQEIHDEKLIIIFELSPKTRPLLQE